LYKGKNKATTASEKYVEFSPDYANILSTNYYEDDSNYKNIAYVEYQNEAGEKALLSMHNGSTEPTGENRREVYVDGTSTSRTITLEELQQLFPNVKKGEGAYYITENGKQVKVATITVTESNFTTEDGEEVNITTETLTVTDYTYLLLIRMLGQNALAEHVSVQSFSGAVDTVDTYEYKTDYDLGDIVKVANEYGIEATA
jgi:hypothetical protein